MVEAFYTSSNFGELVEKEESLLDRMTAYCINNNKKIQSTFFISSNHLLTFVLKIKIINNDNN